MTHSIYFFKMLQKKSTTKNRGLTLAFCALSFLYGFGNCTPITSENDVGSMETQDEMEVVLSTEFQNEARIFGNFSLFNSSILTVAGFVIVGIILFGKVISNTSFFATIKLGRACNIFITMSKCAFFACRECISVNQWAVKKYPDT